jgi:hypothetical protein
LSTPSATSVKRHAGASPSQRKLSLRAALRHPGSLPGLLKAALHPPVGLFFRTYPVEVLGGTDMSDVSRVVPAIHPFLGIGGFAAPHSVGFTRPGQQRPSLSGDDRCGRRSCVDGDRCGHRALAEGSSLPEAGTVMANRNCTRITDGRHQGPVQAIINEQRATLVKLAHDIHEHLDHLVAHATGGG